MNIIDEINSIQYNKKMIIVYNYTIQHNIEKFNMSPIHMIHVHRGCEGSTDASDVMPGESVRGGASHPGSFWLIRGARLPRAATRSRE